MIGKSIRTSPILLDFQGVSGFVLIITYGHTCAAEWYKVFIQCGSNPYQARKSVSKLLGHGRDDVTRIYLASLTKSPQKSSDKDDLLFCPEVVYTMDDDGTEDERRGGNA